MKLIFRIIIYTMICLSIIVAAKIEESYHYDMVKFYNDISQSYSRRVKLQKSVRENKEKDKIASWYDYDLDGFPGYSEYNLTAASRDYPKGTCLVVTRIDTKESIAVRVNDYGPEEQTGRDIDLSSYAFAQLAPFNWGLIDVKIEKLNGECL